MSPMHGVRPASVPPHPPSQHADLPCLARCRPRAVFAVWRKHARALHFWSASDTDYRVYPTSAPMSDELTKRGYYRDHAQEGRPRLAPDRRHAQADTRPADVNPARARQPARHPRDLRRLAGLPDPRHPRHAQNRPPLLVGLHRPLQRRHRRALPALPHRHPGPRHLTRGATGRAAPSRHARLRVQHGRRHRPPLDGNRKK